MRGIRMFMLMLVVMILLIVTSGCGQLSGRCWCGW